MSSPGPAAATSFGRRIGDLALRHPERVALVHVRPDGIERPVSWQELDRRSNQCARLMASRGVAQGSMVAIAIPNSAEHYFSVIGAWRLGATVLPIRWDLPLWERDRLLKLADPRLVVADWADGPAYMLSLAEVRSSDTLDASPLPDRIADPAQGLTSSGSTGSPKLIIMPIPGVVNDLAAGGTKQYMKLRDDVTQLVISPLYHTNGFMSHSGLQDGQRLVVMEKFTPELAIDLIERHQVNFIVMVPIMLQRIARVENVRSRNFSSIDAVLYGAGLLPAWVARAWFDLIGPQRFFIAYGGTERIGTTMATGVEWLAHEGTVGLPLNCEVRILDPEGKALPAGEVGEIFMKSTLPMKLFDYRGAPMPKQTADGFSTFGDLGWQDKDGYLYISDRRVDLIKSGGANVFPAEVETAISEHPNVADVVVVGLPDTEWGKRVHAIVEPSPGTSLTELDLRAWCKARLAAYKVPKSFEFVERMPRSAAGKLNRQALASERAA